MKKIPVVMCIDVEPDERLIDPTVQKDWSGFEATYEIFNKLRPRLEAATGSPVHFSWFFRMDPQIAITYGSASWAVTRYRSLIKEINGLAMRLVCTRIPGGGMRALINGS